MCLAEQSRKAYVSTCSNRGAAEARKSRVKSLPIASPAPVARVVLAPALRSAVVALTHRLTHVKLAKVEVGAGGTVAARSGSVLVRVRPGQERAMEALTPAKLADGTRGWTALCSFTVTVTCGDDRVADRTVLNRRVVFLPDAAWQKWKMSPDAGLYLPSTLMAAVDVPLMQDAPGGAMTLHLAESRRLAVSGYTGAMADLAACMGGGNARVDAAAGADTRAGAGTGAGAGAGAGADAGAGVDPPS